MTIIGNARTIAGFIENVAQQPLPVDVENAARMCLADWVAVALGAYDQTAGQLARDVASSWQSAGPSPVLLAGTASPIASALVNGTFAHCLDFDDTHVGSLSHLSGPTWAAVLALAAERPMTEAGILRAFVSGFEVGARIGGNLFGETVNQRGFHATSVFGKFAATAAACTALGLRGDAIAHALGIAATQGNGLVASFGTMGKPLHAGKAAMDGVLSAQLAARGFTANPELLEPGARGFSDVLLQDQSVGIASLSFDGGWEVLNNTFKPYAACLMTHPAIEAAQQIGTQVHPAQVLKIEARVNPMAIRFASKTELHEPLDGKFSLSFCIALGLAGRDLTQGDFNDASIRDTDYLRLMSCVELIPDQSIKATSASLRVVCEDGGIISMDIPLASGTPGRPMTWHQMQKKFASLTQPVLGDATHSIFNAIKTFGAGDCFPALIATIADAGNDNT